MSTVFSARGVRYSIAIFHEENRVDLARTCMVREQNAKKQWRCVDALAHRSRPAVRQNRRFRKGNRGFSITITIRAEAHAIFAPPNTHNTRQIFSSAYSCIWSAWGHTAWLNAIVSDAATKRNIPQRSYGAHKFRRIAPTLQKEATGPLAQSPALDHAFRHVQWPPQFYLP